MTKTYWNKTECNDHGKWLEKLLEESKNEQSKRWQLYPRRVFSGSKKWLFLDIFVWINTKLSLGNIPCISNWVWKFWNINVEYFLFSMNLIWFLNWKVVEKTWYFTSVNDLIFLFQTNTEWASYFSLRDETLNSERFISEKALKNYQLHNFC